jgi:YD repeat-containing protein
MKKVLLAATVLTLGFTACKKDSSNNPGTNPGQPGGKLLSKITKVENGQTIVYNASYDGNKRLTSIMSVDGTEYQKFTYDANGNVKTAEERNEDFKNIYSYNYNNGVPATATFKSWRVENGQVSNTLHEDDELTYTVTNNLVTKIDVKMKLANNLQIPFEVKYKNGNVNIIEGGAQGIQFYVQFDFGTKKSPIPTVYKYVMDQAGFSAQFMGKNEMAAVLYDFGGVIPGFGKQTQYTYDGAGYPLTATDGDATYKFDYQ